MEIYGRFPTQKVIRYNRQKRRKCHATGNQKKTGQKARKSAHRQGQLQYLRLVDSPTEGRVEKLSPHFTQGVKNGMQN